MRRWTWTCCGALVALATVPVFYGLEAGTDFPPTPVAPQASVASDAGIQPPAPVPAEPSLDPPVPVPVIDFCCARCDGRYNLCVANCGGDPACIQVCEDRFDACAAGCAGGC